MLCKALNTSYMILRIHLTCRKVRIGDAVWWTSEKGCRYQQHKYSHNSLHIISHL